MYIWIKVFGDLHKIIAAASSSTIQIEEIKMMLPVSASVVITKLSHLPEYYTNTAIQHLHFTTHPS